MIKRLLVIGILSAFGILYFACSSSSSKDAVKFQLYYAAGENIYIARCSNCHQKSGDGLGLVYPPLAQSDYMDKNFGDVLCLIKYGKKGPLIVNGSQFNQPMPGVPTLTALEVSELATYIYNTWGHQRGIVEFKEVDKGLEKCEH